MVYPAEERLLLHRVALESIESGLQAGVPVAVNPEEFPQTLRCLRASFVTLKQAAGLRGCIGSLEPRTSLVEDVAHNAFAAAFRDPRFQPLRPGELDTLTVEVSVLGPKEPLIFSSEQGLIDALRPGIDGLVLQDGVYKGTFLPSVWESLPQPDEFLQHLKLKAGLPADHWSDTLTVWRYTTEAFSAGIAEIRSDLGWKQHDEYQKNEHQRQQ
ncbi:MAG: AmmeMemoRadiSam system protein A [Gammaproteobacteria bacterium]|jgi:AmmeMemoRadiSam system protein A